MARVEDEEEQSSGSEAETQAEARDFANGGGSGGAAVGTSSSGMLKIKIGAGSGPDVCHVCGQRGHTSGFRGAVYFDCPNKPCYLCGTVGHSTMTCPFRIAPGHGCTAAAGLGNESVLAGLAGRELDGRRRPLAADPQHLRRQRWQIDAAVLKLHSRRVTCLEFHPTNDHLVLSGDKKGQIAIWDYTKVFERTVYEQGSVNRWLTNALRFMPGSDTSCATCSYDGTVKVFDVETGGTHTLFTANAAGWEQVEEEDAAGKWVTMIGLDVVPAVGLVAAGDSAGQLHLLDPRASAPLFSLQAHKKGTKVQCVACNPADNHLLLTAGNDYFARVLDIRRLAGGPSSAASDAAAAAAAAAAKGKAPAGTGGTPATPPEVAALKHPRVINAAYFSPLSGRKILTTAQDNRLRVWDYLVAADQPADREVVHSHTFNRYLTPFRAEWDPKDAQERLVLCGRYISEDYGGVALHPVDIIDAATGALLGCLVDPNLTTISPVNKPHPRCDVIVSGSSRSLYAWRPADDSDAESEDEREAAGRHGGSTGPSSCGANGAGAQPPSGLRGSAHYVVFDADPDVEKAKRKVSTKAKSSPAAASTQHQHKRAQTEHQLQAAESAGEEAEDGSDAGPSRRGGSKNKGSGRRKKARSPG